MSCSFQISFQILLGKTQNYISNFCCSIVWLKSVDIGRDFNQEDSISDTEDRARFKDPSEIRVAQSPSECLVSRRYSSLHVIIFLVFQCFFGGREETRKIRISVNVYSSRSCVKCCRN